MSLFFFFVAFSLLALLVQLWEGATWVGIVLPFGALLWWRQPGAIQLEELGQVVEPMTRRNCIPTSDNNYEMILWLLYKAYK